MTDTMASIFEQQVWDLFARIETAKGKAKTEALADFDTQIGTQYGPNSEERLALQSIFRFAYDDTIRFQVSDVPPGFEGGGIYPRAFGGWVFDELNRLRSISGTDAQAARIHILNDLGSALSRPMAVIVTRIIRKDLRLGIGERATRAVWPDLIGEFAVQLASPLKERAQVWPCNVEPKLDGMRVMAIVDLTVTSAEESVGFFSRTGKDVPAIAKIKSQVRQLADAVAVVIANSGDEAPTIIHLDGEVTSGKNFNEAISAARKGTALLDVSDIHFHVFDVLAHRNFHLQSMRTSEELALFGNYRERRSTLRQALDRAQNMGAMPSIAPVVSYVVSTEAEMWRYYDSFRNLGFEGAIVKNPASHYQKKRSTDWMKIKAEETLDIQIVGAFEGMGQFQNALGGLIVEHKGQQVKVGSGFTAEERVRLWADVQSDFRLKEEGALEGFQILHKIAEVQYQEETPAGSLRHPVFIRLRDKHASAVGSF